LIKYIDGQINIAAEPWAKPVRNIYINVEQKDVVKYITINHIQSHYLLRKTVKYPVRKNTLAIFDHEHGVYTHKQIQSLYWYNWLYYASFSPIWNNRIREKNGKIDTEKKLVDFEDDDMDTFYDEYGYEPDEQSIETQISTGLALSIL
jgi:hypothetical protein